jgi:hypothetical protein
VAAKSEHDREYHQPANVRQIRTIHRRKH